MRDVRLFTEQPLAPGALVALEPRAAQHATRVLRLAAGDPVTLFNGDGHDHGGRIETLRREQVSVRVTGVGPAEPAAPLAITLGLGISRGERMDLSLQKAVELGVAGIVPLQTGRGVVKLDQERQDKRLGHWRGIVIAACEQSGRRRLPALAPPQALADWLAEGQPNGLLLDHRAAAALPDLFPDWREIPPPAGTPVTLLIGPEGGLTPTERDLARAQGFTGVRLGPRILRTETAPLAAIAVIQALWGDFRGG